MKLCKDCKHCKFVDDASSRCAAPQNEKVSLVTGEKIAAKYSLCTILRSTDELYRSPGVKAGDMPAPDVWLTCGPAGRWFEPIQEPSLRDQVYAMAIESARSAIERERAGALQSASDHIY